MSSFYRYIESGRSEIDWPMLIKQRLESANKAMEKHELDAMLVNSYENVIYLANWPLWETGVLGQTFSALYIKGSDEPVLFALQAEVKDLNAHSWFKDARPLASANSEWVSVWAQAIRDYSLDGKRVGLDPKIQGKLCERIKQDVAGVYFVDAGPVLSTMRIIKTSEEIKLYRTAVANTEAAMITAIEMGKKSWGRYTEIDIASRANYELLKNGVTSVNFWCTSGEYGAYTKRYPTHKRVRGGELLLLDGGGSTHGYRSEFARTIWTGGAPSKEQRLAYQTIWKAHEKVKGMLRPGITTAEVDRVILSVVEEKGFLSYYGGYPYTGHGIGITSEQPSFAEEYPEFNTTLQTGMIFNLEPAIWKPGIGSCRIEDTYLITDDGYEILSRAPYEEELIASRQ